MQIYNTSYNMDIRNMDIYNVGGLPLHVLLVHAVVVLVPVAAICIVLAAVWPTARRRLGIVIALLGVALIVLIPVTMQAGLWLQARVVNTPLILAHVALGSALWPWTLSLGILGILTWLWFFVTGRRDPAAHPRLRRTVGVIIIIAAVGLGTVATWQTVLVGEAGSRALWQNSFSDNPRP